MSAEILQDIINRYHLATATHRELADTFWFVYLPGYALWNEYQLVEEQNVQRKVKRYAMSTYDIALPDELPSSDSSIVALTKGLNRKKLSEDTVKSIVRKAFYKYQEWETETLACYQDCAVKLFEGGEVSAYNFVSEIVADVKAELMFVADKVIELNSHSFDMPQIVAENVDYYERYCHLFGKLFRGKAIKELHHFNGSYDIKTRVKESII